MSKVLSAIASKILYLAFKLNCWLGIKLTNGTTSWFEAPPLYESHIVEGKINFEIGIEKNIDDNII